MTKAMSSLLSDAFEFVFRLLVFILFGNPLSMWFINLLFPQLAAKFARNELYFGPKIYAFYEKHALNWPFYWAKKWMLLEKLASYSIEQQVQYFLKVSFKNGTEVKTLEAMKEHTFWPAAFEMLFFKYGNKKLPLKPESHWKKVGECSVGYWVDVTVADFMMRHTRLSYNALEVAIKKAMNSDFAREELQKYLASGALNESQLYLLIDAVANNSGSGDFQMMLSAIIYAKNIGNALKNIILDRLLNCWKRLRIRLNKQKLCVLFRILRKDVIHGGNSAVQHRIFCLWLREKWHYGSMIFSMIPDIRLIMMQF